MRIRVIRRCEPTFRNILPPSYPGYESITLKKESGSASETFALSSLPGFSSQKTLTLNQYCSTSSHSLCITWAIHGVTTINMCFKHRNMENGWKKCMRWFRLAWPRFKAMVVWSETSSYTHTHTHTHTQKQVRRTRKQKQRQDWMAAKTQLG